jgi:hypothetical protein
MQPRPVAEPVEWGSGVQFPLTSGVLPLVSSSRSEEIRPFYEMCDFEMPDEAKASHDAVAAKLQNDRPARARS